MSITTRERLTPQESQAAALEAARRLLIERGPQAVTLKAVVLKSRAGEVDPIAVVDGTFDAFGKEGAGALAAWMILSGNRDALNPILESIDQMVDQLVEGYEDRPVHETTLWLVLIAIGDSLLGGPMAEALGLPRDKAREVARRQLIAARTTGGPNTA